MKNFLKLWGWQFYVVRVGVSKKIVFQINRNLQNYPNCEINFE